MCIIDFHVHGKITNKAAFCEKSFLSKIEEAKVEGLNAFVLIEHSHAVNFYEAFDFLDNNYEYKNCYFDINGFKVV